MGVKVAVKEGSGVGVSVAVREGEGIGVKEGSGVGVRVVVNEGTGVGISVATVGEGVDVAVGVGKGTGVAVVVGVIVSPSLLVENIGPKILFSSSFSNQILLVESTCAHIDISGVSELKLLYSGL